MEELPGTIGGPAQMSDGRPAQAVSERDRGDGGAHVSEPRCAAIIPTSISAPIAEPRLGDPQFATMQAGFAADFAEARMGQRHNTFQHRSRVLRQMAEAERLRAIGRQSE